MRRQLREGRTGLPDQGPGSTVQCGAKPDQALSLRLKGLSSSVAESIRGPGELLPVVSEHRTGVDTHQSLLLLAVARATLTETVPNALGQL